MSDTTCTHHSDQQREECPVCLVAALIAAHHSDQKREECPVCLVASLTAERDQLRECLRNLVDEQNGAPLERRRKRWQAAMDEALAALDATEGAK